MQDGESVERSQGLICLGTGVCGGNSKETYLEAAVVDLEPWCCGGVWLKLAG